MQLRQRVIPMFLLMVVAFAGVALAAGEGRMLGTVVDEAGNPLQGVKVVVTSPDLAGFEEERTTKKNGTFSVVFSKGYLRYIYRLEMEGFRPQETSVKTSLGGTTRHTFTLSEGQLTEPVTADGTVPASKSNAAIFAFNNAVTAFQGGDLATAKAGFLEAVEKDELFHQAHTALSEVYLTEGEFQLAAASAEKALAQEPGSAAAMRVRFEAYKGLGDKDKMEEAAEALKAAGRNTDQAKKIYNEGVQLAKAGDEAGAMAKFTEAAQMDPALTEAYSAQITLFLKKQDYQGMATASEAWLEKDGDAEKALRARYDAYVGLGDAVKAGEALLGLASVDKDFASAGLYNIAIQQFNAGQMDAATASFNKALEVNPEHAKAHYHLGLALINTGDSGGAKTHLQRFLDLAAADDPDVTTAKEMIAYL